MTTTPTTTTPAETNRLVLAGTHARVFVCELEPGDVTALDWTVWSVARASDHSTRVTATDGTVYWYGDPATTILVERACCDPDAPRDYSGNGHDADCDDYDGAPCCADPGCSGAPCTFPGYAASH